MSSRAIRKLRREMEQEKEAQKLKDEGSHSDESEEEQVPALKAKNAFDLLNNAEEQHGENEYPVAEESAEESAEDNSDPDVAHNEAKPVLSNVPGPKKKPKKKKNKKKGKTANVAEKASGNAEEMDDIDRALQSLSTKPVDDASESTRVKIDQANSHLYRLLAVESKHLNALNEMKRLFGNVVLENEDDSPAAPRRRGRGPQQLDLGGALAGRNNPASRGQGLAGLALRRNPFILGKEEWPKATSGGLGMELVEKLEDGTVEFRFLHTSVYQDVQRQFEVCVESMDPQRMITMLQYNPYHISTLLQVSEIAKQQGDHSVSGDLLERALFSFGRSVHSSFTAALTEGKARLDFRRPENREFWLAAWRYTNNLGQKGTWRTAYEWTKLILSLDPEGDPYCMGLVIDQIALRGGQFEHFLELSQCPFFKDDLWRSRINIPISTSLAEYKLKHPRKARESLADAMKAYPWIFASLFKALDIDRTPKSIWGNLARSERARFECELYIHNAKDLWNTPETVSFLVEVAESIESPGKDSLSKAPDVTLEEARHILLTGIPSLINLVPRSFTTRSSLSSDPLPPDDNLPSYSPASPTNGHEAYTSPFEIIEDPETPQDEDAPIPRSPVEQETEGAQAQGGQGPGGLFRNINIPWFRPWLRQGAPAQGSLEEEGRPVTEGTLPPELPGERRARVMSIVEMIPGYPDESEEDRRARLARIDQLIRNPLGSLFSAEDALESNAISPTTAQDNLQQSSGTEPYDEERNQRWLAGQGMLALKEFTTQHGTDENAWSAASHGQEIVAEYARRMLQLRSDRQRTFLMDFTLKQGTNGDVRELVTREMERLK